MQISKRDVLWTYVSRILTIGINLLLLPLVMRFLSDIELGLWYVFSSISQIVNLFDFGFNATISRHMTYAWSGAAQLEKNYVTTNFSNKPNEKLMSAIIMTCRAVYFIISAAGLLVMLSVGTIYVKKVVGRDMTTLIYYAWITYAIAVFLNLFYGYWTSLLQGIGAVEERSKMNVYSKVVQIVVAFALLLMNFGLLGYVVSYLASGMALRLFGKYFFTKKTRRLNLKNSVEKAEIKDCFFKMWNTAWRDGIVMVSQYLSTQANTLICAYYIDLASTSIYGVITQIVSVIASVATAYFNAYQPQYSSACLQGDVETERRIACSTDFIYKIIYLFGMIALVIIGLPLLKIIRPNMNIDIMLLLTTGFFYYLYNQHSLFASMIASSNRIPYYKAFAISAVGCFVLSVLLTKNLGIGIWGLMFGQLVVNLIYNNWKWPLFIMKELHISYIDIYKIGFNEVYKVLKHRRM